MKILKPTIRLLSAGMLMLILGVSAAMAANPATINVTVTIQSLSVTASGPIAFGMVTASSSTVSSDVSSVVNNGNSTETYSLSLTNPGGWTAVQAAPGAEQYCLSAKFNSIQPAGGSYTYADHALSTSSVACSGTKFAGDETGLSVAVSGTRHLYMKFEAPASTAVTTSQTIVVTITASAG